LIWFGEEADEPLFVEPLVDDPLFMFVELEPVVPVVLVPEFWLLEAAPDAPVPV